MPNTVVKPSFFAENTWMVTSGKIGAADTYAPLAPDGRAPTLISGSWVRVPRWCTQISRVTADIFCSSRFFFICPQLFSIYAIIGHMVKTLLHAGIGSSILPRVTNISSRLCEVVMQASQKACYFLLYVDH